MSGGNLGPRFQTPLCRRRQQQQQQQQQRRVHVKERPGPSILQDPDVLLGAQVTCENRKKKQYRRINIV